MHAHWYCKMDHIAKQWALVHDKSVGGTWYWLKEKIDYQINLVAANEAWNWAITRLTSDESARAEHKINFRHNEMWAKRWRRKWSVDAKIKWTKMDFFSCSFSAKWHKWELSKYIYRCRLSSIRYAQFNRITDLPSLVVALLLIELVCSVRKIAMREKNDYFIYQTASTETTELRLYLRFFFSFSKKWNKIDFILHMIYNWDCSNARWRRNIYRSYAFTRKSRNADEPTHTEFWRIPNEWNDFFITIIRMHVLLTVAPAHLSYYFSWWRGAQPLNIILSFRSFSHRQLCAVARGIVGNCRRMWE